MYSYQERIRAVKLYIKLGKRLRATICQLSYPTKNSLKGWYREHEQNRHLQTGYARPKQKYSAEQMRVAVQHYLDHDRCIASTIRALGYPCRAALTGWIDDLHPEVRYRMVGRASNIQHTWVIKHAAVIDLCTRTTRAQAIAEKLAVCRPTLYNGKNQLLSKEDSLSMTRQHESGSPLSSDRAELEKTVDSLKRDIRRLQLEHDILKKANERLKKGLGVAPHRLSNREKMLLVDALKPIIHSDRGAHYRWPGWLSRVHNAELVRSMSRKGCSPDNAACEGFFGRLKTELFYPRNWQDTTVQQFMQIVDAYIRGYNEKRIKVSLGA